MRFPRHFPLAGIAAVLVLLAACEGDPAATTAPTTPSLSQSSPTLPSHVYRFTLTCSDAVSELSFAEIVTDGGHFEVHCGAPQGDNFTSFSYRIVTQGGFIHAECEATGVNTVGPFICKKGSKYSATLMLFDAGPL